jgi:hypothetical protein
MDQSLVDTSPPLLEGNLPTFSLKALKLLLVS